MLGIYVHVPFCNQKCPYCDFYSIPADRQLKSEYVQAVIREMQEVYHGQTADTLYFGGGTPTLLPPQKLEKIVHTARQLYGLKGAEITLEANPNSVSGPMLRNLTEIGFNRISFGMQSAVSRELAALGRQHTPKQVSQAVNLAKEAGFSNISLDLMMGIPYQTKETLKHSLKLIERLNIQHVSAYLLKIEPGTPFFRQKVEDLCLDEDDTADLYLYAQRRLEEMGFHQYEISNFSKTGYESRHNLKYWTDEEYLGFGAAAHSFYNGIRYAHSRDIQTYLKKGVTDRTLVDAKGGSWEEYLMLRLRLTEGVNLDEAKRKFSIDEKTFLKKLEPMHRAGLLCVEKRRVFLTPKGFLLSNSIISRLI